MPETEFSGIDDVCPDWSDETIDVACPLCDYNLRGLSESRCPECGYRFLWRDLLDPSRKSHPYLFEFARGNRFKAFWITAFHSFRPRRFWKTLRADQPIVRGRLWTYAAAVITPCLLAVATIYLAMNLANLIEIRAYNAYMQTRPGGVSYPWFNYYWLPYDENLTHLGIVLGWPAATFLSLMIFRISMRRANVKAAHVMRCVIYSSDIFVWLALAVILVHIICAAEILRHLNAKNASNEFFNFPPWEDGALACAWAIATVIFAYRLAMAYRYYLRFRRGVAVVFATQLIVFLTACIWLMRSFYI